MPTTKSALPQWTTYARRNALVYYCNALAFAERRHDEWRRDDFEAWREDVNRRLAAGESMEAE